MGVSTETFQELVKASTAYKLAVQDILGPTPLGTNTPNYNFNLPDIGGDRNTWGNLLNANWTNLDTILGLIEGGDGSFVPSTGGTYTGSVNFIPTNNAESAIYVSSYNDSSNDVGIKFGETQSDTTADWGLIYNGNDDSFHVERRTAAGAFGEFRLSFYQGYTRFAMVDQDYWEVVDWGNTTRRMRFYPDYRSSDGTYHPYLAIEGNSYGTDPTGALYLGIVDSGNIVAGFTADGKVYGSDFVVIAPTPATASVKTNIELRVGAVLQELLTRVANLES